MKMILFSFLFVLNLHSKEYGLDEKLISDFNTVSSKKNIDAKILLTFAKIETDLKSKVVSYNLEEFERDEHREFYEKYNIKCKILRYKQKYRIAIYPKNKDEAKITLFKCHKRKNVDYGIMQINSSNIERLGVNKAQILLDDRFNIGFAANVVRGCYDRFNKDLKNTIECYNKGVNSKKFTFKYYSKFIKTYNSL